MTGTAPLHQAVAEFFDGQLTLPDPLPSEGGVEGNGWSISFAVNADADGRSTLDFLASDGSSDPLFVHVAADGGVEHLDSFRSHSIHDPRIEDEQAGVDRMEAHNERVTEELRKRRLL